MERLPLIKVFGVGGAGCKVADMLRCKQYNSVEFYAVDEQEAFCEPPEANQIAIRSTSLTDAEKATLADAVKGADFIVLAANANAEFDCAVTPVIARIAKDAGVPVAAAVTTPFSNDTPETLKNAERCLDTLKETCETTVVNGLNELEYLLSEPRAARIVLKSFWMLSADAIDVLISPVVKPSMINVDFEDLLIAIKNSGVAYFAYGSGRGDGRAEQAVRHALNRPTHPKAIENAKSLIVRVVVGGNVSIDEVSTVLKSLADIARPSVNIITSVDCDEDTEDELRIMLVAVQND